MPMLKIHANDRKNRIRDKLKIIFGPGKLIQIRGRGNSLVYKWQMKSGLVFIKTYPEDPHWQRRKQEEKFSNYLSAVGINCHPKVLFSDDKLNFSAFEFIIGQPPDPNNTGVKNQFTSFLRLLTQNTFALTHLMPAKESFNSLTQLIEQISRRHQLLDEIDEPMLSEFLEKKFNPLFTRIRSIDEKSAELSNHYFPSPSDVGLHNCLLSDTGQLIFFDFEYAGICSIYKLIGDLYWHPALGFAPNVRLEMINRLANGKICDDIVRTSIQFMGFKWALLLLNEFHPHVYQKRLEADNNKELVGVKATQLKKSTHVLHQISYLLNNKI